MRNRPDLVLLFSGGYDSTLLLLVAQSIGYTPLCVLINYGQKHVEELSSAIALCEKHDVEYVVIKMELPVASALTTEESKTYEGVSPWHVPARNLIFVSLAASIAESRDIPLIWFGANYEDREKLFPDCYQEWVFHLNNLLAVNGSMKVYVEAPLLGMTKESIKKLASTYNINENEVFSGYGK